MSQASGSRKHRAITTRIPLESTAAVAFRGDATEAARVATDIRLPLSRSKRPDVQDGEGRSDQQHHGGDRGSVADVAEPEGLLEGHDGQGGALVTGSPGGHH